MMRSADASAPRYSLRARVRRGAVGAVVVADAWFMSRACVSRRERCSLCPYSRHAAHGYAERQRDIHLFITLYAHDERYRQFHVEHTMPPEPSPSPARPFTMFAAACLDTFTPPLYYIRSSQRRYSPRMAQRARVEASRRDDRATLFAPAFLEERTRDVIFAA